MTAISGWGKDGVNLSLICQMTSEDIKHQLIIISERVIPNSGATDIVFVILFRTTVGTAIAWYGSCGAMPDGHCLNIMLFWRLSTAALVFRVGACFEVSLFRPPFPTRPRP